MRTNWENIADGQWCTNHFLSLIYCYLHIRLRRGANECSALLEHAPGTFQPIVLSALRVLLAPQVPEATHHVLTLLIALCIFLSLLAIAFPISSCCWTRSRVIFKGLLLDGEGRILRKISATQPLMTSFGLTPILMQLQYVDLSRLTVPLMLYIRCLISMSAFSTDHWFLNSNFLALCTCM